MTFPEMMFYAESEGLLPTRLGKLNAAINELNKDTRNTIPFEDFCQVLEKHGLSFEELTPRELDYINENV